MEKHAFVETGHQIIDWIADYMENGYPGPVSPKSKPGEVIASLPDGPPDLPESPEALLRDFHKLILPHVTHWNDPRFFGYFPANHSGAAILGNLLSSGLNVNAMSWGTCPAATELEIAVMGWLGQMLGLSWPGCIQDTASTATLCALLTAREKVAAINRDGYYDQKPLTVYTSDQAHSSVLKAARIAGIGDRFVRYVSVDRGLAMVPDALERAVRDDLEAGFQPCMVSATVGTTSTTAVDPVAAIAEICSRHGIYLHVDAALAGSAAIVPEMKWLMDGVERADSFLFNPHKWLLTNFDCCAYFCKDPDDLKRALAIQPEYLKTGQDAQVENFRDWSIQLGRAFRALKPWFVLRLYGTQALQDMIREHLQMAQWFAAKIEREPRLVLWQMPRLNTVCFRHQDPAKSAPLMAAINAGGEAFLTHTVIADQYTIRAAFGQAHSTMTHVENLWKTLQKNLDLL